MIETTTGRTTTEEPTTGDEQVHFETHSKWTTGLCGCCEDPSNCLVTTFCPCITFGRNAEIIDKNAVSCACSGLVFMVLSYVGVPCLYSFTYRSKLRGQHSLPEHPCADCCVHCWCLHCALCQEYRELKNRGLDPSIGWAANAERMNKVGAMAPPVVEQGMPR
ncbi:cell number regulator 2 isoform X1 [Hevea brasiliensis]|uniref:cell number regulator 2 isoform X1 n=1 Tax=Hevea brasiliensis TaxID=3981 RepID=UPI0025F5BD83|nr:cell number regulator 2 isoform X1 [Hevea brasiliensis]